MFTTTECPHTRNLSIRPVCKSTDRPLIRELFRKEFYGGQLQPYPDEGLWEIYDNMGAEGPFGAFLVSWREQFLFLMEIHSPVQMDLPPRLLRRPGAIGIYCFFSSPMESTNLPALRACIGGLLDHPAVSRIFTTQTHPMPDDARISLLTRSGFHRLSKSPDHSAIFCCTSKTFLNIHTNSPAARVNQSYILS